MLALWGVLVTPDIEVGLQCGGAVVNFLAKGDTIALGLVVLGVSARRGATIGEDAHQRDAVAIEAAARAR
ncbi:hypothetical protein [Pandoraea sputorum]|uniref:Uncharacterized protein n=1 Tax=Pandoraea sputorum TaxID=93222 RepID=A0A5E5BKF5_9BURK|nr:hypothetical protein [Pandoraea sputorum]VVE85746.1 hypothetical protein PSP31121_05400 [Pandoraea sputorum]